MDGLIIGLIMIGNHYADVEKIGPAISVAFLPIFMGTSLGLFLQELKSKQLLKLNLNIGMFKYLTNNLVCN